MLDTRGGGGARVVDPGQKKHHDGRWDGIGSVGAVFGGDGGWVRKRNEVFGGERWSGGFVFLWESGGRWGRIVKVDGLV